MFNTITGIVQANSLDFVESAFLQLNIGNCIVNLKSADQIPDLPGLKIQQILLSTVRTGWYEGEAYKPSHSDQAAQILFSSGTEGEPKGILVSHAALENTVERLSRVMNLDESIREYIGVPVTYSFGFGRCRAVSAVGGKFYLPPAGFDPLEISTLLKKKEINALSAVPSLCRVLLEAGELFSDERRNLKWIEIGSQYMSAAEKLRLRELFPKATIVQHYGLTEASRSTFLVVSAEPAERIESVGTASMGVEVKLDDNQRIQIRGPHLATALIHQGKITPVTDDDGWLTTSDKGHIDQGYLYFDGRMDDLINYGGIKLSPELLDRKLHDRLGIKSGVHTVKLPDETLGERVGLAVEESCKIDVAFLKSTLREILAEEGIQAGKSILITQVDDFPFTQTGKLQRNVLNASCLELFNKDVVTPMESSTLTTHSAETIPDFSEKSGMEQRLINIWEEVLNIAPISPTESFFDLGGDSLSAIRVILKMEKAGVTRAVCQKIFQGLSINELVGMEPENNQPELPSNHPVSPDNVKADPSSKEIIAIWQEVLQIDNISVHESFFDLGGDSLSAIRVILQMEKAGIPKDVCRRIFEGQNITELSYGYTASRIAPQKSSATPAIAAIVPDLHQDTTNLQANQPTTSNGATFIRRTPLASASLSLNVMRGLLVLMNILAHWMPGVIERLPPIFSEYNRFLAPVYSSGTPGFALTFGAGIGFFLLPRFRKNPKSVTSLSIRNAVLLGSGIIALSLISLLSDLIGGKTIRGMDIANSIYSVLFFYFLAVVSLPFWLKTLTLRGTFFFSCLYAVSVLYGVHVLLTNVFSIPPSQTPIVQVGVLMLNAKYNYPEMFAGVLLGTACGHWFRQRIDKQQSITPLLPAGILLVILSVLISFETGDYAQWFVWPKGSFMFTWPFYLGVILICIYGLHQYIRHYDVSAHRYIGFFIKLISIIGIMAFPLFVGHALVLPVHRLLSNLHVPTALPLTLLAFFGFSVYMVLRLYRMYFGSDKK